MSWSFFQVVPKSSDSHSSSWGGGKEKHGCCLHRYHTAELSPNTTGIAITTLCANTDKMTNQLPLLVIRKQGEVFACEVYMSTKIEVRLTANEH